MYEIGVMVSFSIGIIRIIIAICNIFSVSAENFKKIGLFYSLKQGGFQGTEPIKIQSFFLWIGLVLIVEPLFSWVSVLLYVAMFLYNKNEKGTIPDSAKKYLFKLKNINMNQFEIYQTMVELNAELGVPYKVFKMEFSENVYFKIDYRNENVLLFQKEGSNYSLLLVSKYNITNEKINVKLVGITSNDKLNTKGLDNFLSKDYIELTDVFLMSHIHNPLLLWHS